MFVFVCNDSTPTRKSQETSSVIDPSLSSIYQFWFHPFSFKSHPSLNQALSSYLCSFYLGHKSHLYTVTFPPYKGF